MSIHIVYIHTGHLSVDNGAKNPLSYYAEIAALLGVDKHYGRYYGDDHLEIPHSDWAVVQQLLEENKMLYRIVPRVGHWNAWENVCTERVAGQLNVPFGAATAA